MSSAFFYNLLNAFSGSPQPCSPPTKVFRVRGILRNWNRDKLESVLEEGGLPSPVIKSLALGVEGGFQEATVSFPNSPNQPPKSLIVGPSSIHFDDKFHGTTTLYSPPSGDHKVE